MLVKQPTLNPTRKLSAVVIATAVLEIARVTFSALYPGLFDAAYWAAMQPIAVFAVGYFVKDEANVAPEFTGEHT